jgi:type II secretory pathway pseudopilin PulG
MRVVVVIIGGVLVLGGGAFVAVADQQRVAALEQAEAAVEHAQQELESRVDAKLDLAGTLCALRSLLAEQDAQLADTTGFLR